MDGHTMLHSLNTPFKVIQSHQFWYRWKTHMRLHYLTLYLTLFARYHVLLVEFFARTWECLSSTDSFGGKSLNSWSRNHQADCACNFFLFSKYIDISIHFSSSWHEAVRSNYLAVCWRRAFRKVSGWNSSERSRVSWRSRPCSDFSSQICVAAALLTSPRR